jgi:hypothetical protein
MGADEGKIISGRLTAHSIQRTDDLEKIIGSWDQR